MLKMELQLFAEGAAAGAGEETGEGTSAAAAQEGLQAAAGTEKEFTSNTETDRAAAFEELIKGEYRDEFNKRTQNIINQRFADHKELQKKVTASEPLLAMLAQKYGVKDASDIDGILHALEEDSSFYEEEAMEKGISVEQLKYQKQLERENESFRRAREEAERRQNAQRVAEKWMLDAEELKKIYPGFDLRTESENEDFMGLLKNGIPVRTAYEVIHKDEIIGGAMQYTAQQVAQKVANNVQARGRRPAENGSGSQAAGAAKFDVANSTKAQRDELEKRALRGERIVL